MFYCNNLCVSIADTPILSNLSFVIKPGTVHALMGPNGSGKSTFAHTIAGNPDYTITNGSLCFKNQNITTFSPAKRAQSGIFLSFQQPPAIPGLQVVMLLREAYVAVTNKPIAMQQFQNKLQEYLRLLDIDDSFLQRSCNDGFSGGERKRFELLQMLVLRPTFIILDEIDSGLDIDALKLVSRVMDVICKENPSVAILIITHYQRIFEYITPDVVHILCDGKLVDSGDASLVHVLERKGYDAYKQNAP